MGAPPHCLAHAAAPPPPSLTPPTPHPFTSSHFPPLPTRPRRYKEAVAECSAALDGQPNFFKALIRRAKAYEQMGQHKQALADMQRANKLDAATEDTRVGGGPAVAEWGGPEGLRFCVPSGSPPPPDAVRTAPAPCAERLPAPAPRPACRRTASGG